MTNEGRILPPPYRGIPPFDYSTRRLFFGREADTERLLAKVLLQRVVVLFGDSGAGKSSLINASLIPALDRFGFNAERVRVRPVSDEPLAIERIPFEYEESDFRPSLFAAPRSDAIVAMSLPRFEAIVTGAADANAARESGTNRAAPGWPVLIFDQFEELFTLFGTGPDGIGELSLKSDILSVVYRLARRDDLRVKIVIGIREDFVGRLEVLAKGLPAILDHRVRVGALNRNSAVRAILGPFRDPYPSRPTPQLARQIIRDLERQEAARTIAPTQLQIVCQRLWDAYSARVTTIDRPEYQALGGVKGIVEGFFESEIAKIPVEERHTAGAVLERLVTAAGTRDVVSRDKVAETAPGGHVDSVLRRLEALRIVNRTSQRNTDYFDISSEYLIAPILALAKRYAADRDRQAAERAAAEAARKDAEVRYARQLRTTNWTLAALAIVLAIVAVVAFVNARRALENRADAQQQRDRATAAAAQAVTLRTVAERNAEEAKRLAADARRLGLDAEQNARLAREREAAAVVTANQAAAAARIARANELASTALASLAFDPERALREAMASVEATSRDGHIENRAFDALQQAVQEGRVTAALSVSEPQGLPRFVVSHNGAVGVILGLRTARVLDLTTGRQLATSDRSFFSSSAALNASGRLLVAADFGGAAAIALFELPSFREVARFRLTLPDYERPALLEISRDDRYIAGELRNGTLFVYDRSTGTQVDRIETGGFGLDRSGLDRLTITAGNELWLTRPRGQDTVLQRIKLGDLSEIGSPIALSAALGGGGAVELSRDGRFAVLGNELFRLPELTNTGLKLNGFAGSFAISPDNQRVADTEGQWIRIWNVASGRPELLLDSHDPWTNALVFVTPTRLASLGHGGLLRFWNVGTSADAVFNAVAGRFAPQPLFIFSNDARTLLSVGSDDLRRWEVATGRLLTSTQIKMLARPIAAAPDTRELALDESDGISTMPASEAGESGSWSIGDPNVAAEFAGARYTDTNGLMTARNIAAGQSTEIWAVKARRRLAVIPRADQVWFNRRGDAYAAVTRTTVIATLGGDVVFTVPQRASAAEFSASGNRVALVVGDRIVVIDVARRAVIATLSVTGVSSLALNGGGTRLAAGNDERRVIVWDVNSGRQLHSFGGHQYSVQVIAFDPDGRHVRTVGADGTVRSYWLDSAELVAQARKLLAASTR